MVGVLMPTTLGRADQQPVSTRSAASAGCRSVAAEMVVFGVLGPLQAEDGGRLLDLRGPRHREVLARLLVARGRVVSVARLVDDLWDDPPEGAVGAVQTFVGALRRALEPDRPPRSPARLLVTAAPATSA
jgi:DNA-binding SARP family transcriptional activator